MKEQIKFEVIVVGQTRLVETQEGRYRNLMQLFVDQFYLDGFGACGGQGKCATCMIKIVSSKTALSCSDRNEESTLLKANIKDARIRLSCQIMITEEINHAQFEVLAPD